MDVARALAAAGASEGLCVVAETQTAGRGRLGRAWYSPPGAALYFSLLLRPALPATQAGWLSMLAALAVLDGAAEILGPTGALALKWPNDVLLSGRKLAGILIETALSGPVLEHVIVGVGLNVNTRFDGAPEDVRARAISLRDASGRDLDVGAALETMLRAFDMRYAALMADPASPAAEYAAWLVTLGQRVTLTAGDEVLEGLASGVREDGALWVETDSGRRAAAFGDVS